VDASRLVPIFLDLNSRDVLVVGAGEIAARKIHDLISAGARVRVVAEKATDEILEIAKRSEIRLDLRSFEDGDIAAAWLVISATGRPAVERNVFLECQRQKKFVIAVDDLANGSAASGSVIRRPPFVVAISSSAEAPALTRLLREVLERVLPDDKWIEAARQLRKKWKASSTPMTSRFEELVKAVMEDDSGDA
jgi:uroporphyrin-III C-methyltransferase/precorrin-2 dehydrogenase/sirohydrochlorin ferrochelatase